MQSYTHTHTTQISFGQTMQTPYKKTDLELENWDLESSDLIYHLLDWTHMHLFHSKSNLIHLQSYAIINEKKKESPPILHTKHKYNRM